MKKIAFSLLSIIMLVAMTLPIASPAVGAVSPKYPVLNIQVDPSMNASIYIWDTTEGTWAIDQDTGLPIDGTNHQSPAQISVAKNHCYRVWVEREGSLFKVKKLPNQGNWTGIGYHEAEGCVGDSGNYGFHFSTKVIAENYPPIADANGPYEACVGEPITFDGSGSSDPDPADTLEYRWDFQSNGTWDTNWSNSSYANNTWYAPFAGNVTLEGRDLYGGPPIGGNEL